MRGHEFSVLVISHGRANHLQQLLSGIDRSLERPLEVVIVYMNETSPPPVSCTVPLKIVHVCSPAGHAGLPLARARNAAAEAAQGTDLVFLDVDCIPSANAFGDLLAAIQQRPALAMAEPRYLRAPLPDGLLVNDQLLHGLSVPHHARDGLHYGIPTLRHELFWSLGFAIPAADFALLGGFDEGFSGYGGEDTDFGFRAREAEVPMLFLPAPVFHQHHGVYKPPLNHFAAIISNARHFNIRWNRWPMEGWLGAFADLGLIHWRPESPAITVLRVPTETEIEAARSHDPY